jgi:hypothetical protein
MRAAACGMASRSAVPTRTATSTVDLILVGPGRRFSGSELLQGDCRARVASHKIRALALSAIRSRPGVVTFACFTESARLAILRCVPSLGGNEGEKAGEFSRRSFTRATVKAGMAAGAAIWVAPQLSSVALAQTTAGSPPPSTTRPRGGGATDPGNPGDPGIAAGDPSGGGTGVSGIPNAGTPGADGELALTGSDVRTLAATGGAAVATGSALVAAERVSKRRLAPPAPAGEGPSDETAR